MTTKNIYLILNNIRSVHNTGAIFRTADACGISKIYLCGYTPAPIDRFGRARKDLAKCALGAEKTAAWEARPDAIGLIKELKKQKLAVIAAEQAENSVDYKKVKIAGDAAIIFGNEPNGLPKEILDECDIVAEIPMLGKKESLNVSVAAGVILYRILNI